MAPVCAIFQLQRNVRVDGAQAIERGKIELVRTDFYRVYRGMSETGWEERERERDIYGAGATEDDRLTMPFAAKRAIFVVAIAKGVCYKTSVSALCSLCKSE